MNDLAINPTETKGTHSSAMVLASTTQTPPQSYFKSCHFNLPQISWLGRLTDEPTNRLTFLLLILL